MCPPAKTNNSKKIFVRNISTVSQKMIYFAGRMIVTGIRLKLRFSCHEQRMPKHSPAYTPGLPEADSEQSLQTRYESKQLPPCGQACPQFGIKRSIV
jgi:hypothetical protein